MAFDFPTSPAVGDVMNGYQWDGEKWRGGAAAREPDEQFFDLAGLTTKDIVVPAWAKGCTLDGAAYMPNTATQLCLRYSLDGTTFLVGASDYSYGGPTHQDGSASFAKTVSTAGTAILLGGQGDVVAVPHKFMASIALTRPDTAKVLGIVEAYIKMMDTAAANLVRTAWFGGWVTAAAGGSALTIKAIRILQFSGGVFGAGSFVRVKWIGAQAQQTIAMMNKVTISTADPSGGAPGDIWFKVV